MDVELMMEEALKPRLMFQLGKALGLGEHYRWGGPEWSDREPRGEGNHPDRPRPDTKHLAGQITVVTPAQLCCMHVSKWAWLGSNKTLFTKITVGQVWTMDILKIPCGDKCGVSGGLKCWMIVGEEVL